MTNTALNKFHLPYWIGTPYSDRIDIEQDLVSIASNETSLDSFRTLSSLAKYNIRPKYVKFFKWHKTVTNESHSTAYGFASHYKHWEIDKAKTYKVE